MACFTWPPYIPDCFVLTPPISQLLSYPANAIERKKRGPQCSNRASPVGGLARLHDYVIVLRLEFLESGMFFRAYDI